MSCDISQLFHTIIASSKTDNVIRTLHHRRTSSGSDAFTFNCRAVRLNENLTVLSGYLERIHELTSGTLGNMVKQRMHNELTEQVVILIKQCTVLLKQLQDLIYINEQDVGKIMDRQSQICTHRSVVHRLLNDQLENLIKLKDEELNRQQHLLELSGNLAAGVKSISLNGQKRFNSLQNSKLPCDNTVVANTNLLRKRNLQQNNLPESNTKIGMDSNAYFTETELKTLELENQTLYGQFVRERDEMGFVAKSINEISRLNQTLSGHLLEQYETVEQIENASVAATESIRQGNELFREAINRKATTQFWILFILIVLTFSLHFLDWYYP